MIYSSRASQAAFDESSQHRGRVRGDGEEEKKKDFNSRPNLMALAVPLVPKKNTKPRQTPKEHDKKVIIPESHTLLGYPSRDSMACI